MCNTLCFFFARVNCDHSSSFLTIIMSTENRTPTNEHKMEPEYKRDSEDILIDFEGEDDPYKPLNWPLRKKIVVTILYSLCTMGTTWASTMYVITY